MRQILHQTWTFLHRNYLDDSEGRSYGQLVTGSFITTAHPLMHHDLCRVFWWNVKSPRGLSPLQPRSGALWLLASPKTKTTFEREEISDCRSHSGKYNRAADGDWENCVRSQGAYFEGDWGVIVLCTMFLVSCIFFSKYLYFSYYMDGYLMDRPHMSEVDAGDSSTIFCGLKWHEDQYFRRVQVLKKPPLVMLD